MFHSLVVIRTITAIITGRNSLILITFILELLVSNCFNRKVSVCLHQNGWQLTFDVSFHITLTLYAIANIGLELAIDPPPPPPGGILYTMIF